MKTKNVSRLILTALFTAVAYLSVMVMPIHVSFLTLDIKDAIMTIGALYLGPIAGVAMAVLVSFIEFLTFSGTGVYGLVMNIIGSSAFVVVASLLYHRKKSLTNAVLSLVLACFSMTVVMLAMNLVITPLYTGLSVSAVAEMILPLLLPFNLAKGVLNAALVMMLYKPVTVALRRTRLGGGSNEKLTKTSAIVSAVAIAVVALALLFLFVNLKASV